MKALFKPLMTMVCLDTLFLGLGLPSGMVICYGANGHVAMEARDGSCPAQAELQSSKSQDIPHAEQPSMIGTQQSNTCTDILLTLQSTPSPPSEPSLLSLSLEPTSLAKVPLVPLDVWLQSATIQQHSLQRLPSSNLFLNSYRTVVLRI